MDGATTGWDEIERHFWLTRSMARMMGVNLSRAMESGLLDTSEYIEMVTRCRAADCHESCQLWLAKQTGTATQVPAQCIHGDVLNRLR